MKSTCGGIKTGGIEITFAPSAYPDAVAKKLVEGLRKGEIPSRFHYETAEQAALWLKLHEKYSPARTDPDCRRIYQRAGKSAVEFFSGNFQIVALGCGGGQKEVGLLRQAKGEADFVAVDVSAPLVLTTMQLAARHTKEVRGIVCDIEAGNKIELPPARKRLVIFFGVLPNIEPKKLKKILSPWLRPGDLLLLSANMVPDVSGIHKVIGGYDNSEAREWLGVFLKNLGLQGTPKDILFQTTSVAKVPGAKKIQAIFKTKSQSLVKVYGEKVSIKKGAGLRLFHSWRYTEAGVRHLLSSIGSVKQAWITSNKEEGVFLVTI